MSGDDPAWWDAAACLSSDPDLFFPQGGTTRKAVAICAGCPVRAECLEYAMGNKEKFGIWGGTTEKDRRRIRRQRNKERREQQQ